MTTDTTIETPPPASLGIPSSNDLNKIPDDLLGPIPAEIRLGSNTLMVMDKPPEVRDVVTVMARLRIKDAGVEEAGDGGEDLTHYRKARLVTAWLAGQPKPPNPDDPDQGALFDNPDDAEIAAAKELLAAHGFGITEPEPEPVEVADDSGDEDGGNDPDNVARPDFSSSTE